ncbi:MAG: PP2C family protein-serine/threonine phosphatase [Vulcanimicrobiota bacterium]
MAPAPNPVFDFHREVLEGAPQAILVVDEQGVLQFVNRAAEGLFGYETHALAGRPVTDVLPLWFGLPLRGVGDDTVGRDVDGAEVMVQVKVRLLATALGPVAVASLRDVTRERAQVRDLRSQRKELRQQVNDLDQARGAAQSQLKAAARVLESYLPERPPRPLPIDVYWAFEPCETLGGDMLVFHPIDEYRYMLGVLDVSGHGPAASLLSVSLAKSLSPELGQGGLVRGRDGNLRAPHEVVSRLNRGFRTFFEAGLFVTAIYGILDLPNRRLDYICAGHPHPLLRRQGRTCAVAGPIGPPLGIEPKARYQPTSLVLVEGDQLFFYTDGVTETRSPNRDFFGEDGLAARLTGSGSAPVKQVVDGLLLELANFRGGQAPTDDVAILAFGVPYPEPESLPT